MTHFSPLPSPIYELSRHFGFNQLNVTDANYSSFIIKEEDNEQATTYVHTFLLKKTIESDNRECKYRRHFQGRTIAEIPIQDFHWESNCFITRKSLLSWN